MAEHPDAAQEYAVLRQAGTERPWSGEYVSTHTAGTYHCRACDAPLFQSQAKYDSHCGWPSFYEPGEGDAVTLHQDKSHGMVRVEVRCAASADRTWGTCSRTGRWSTAGSGTASTPCA